MAAADRIGHRIVRLASTGSTNDDAKRLALGGAAEGTVIAAQHQTEGRGRQGRVWLSPPGLGLYASIVLRPGWPGSDAQWLGVLAGLAVLDAVRALGVRDATLKWPNDVLVRGRKLCGILVEPRLAKGFIDFAIIGVGLNLAHTRKDWPRHMVDTAVSLRQLRVKADADRVLDAICTSMQRVYDHTRQQGTASLIPLWRAESGRRALPEIG